MDLKYTGVGLGVIYKDMDLTDTKVKSLRYHSLVCIKGRIPSTHKKRAPIKDHFFCFAYPSDLDQAYAFYCARYENISFKEF